MIALKIALMLKILLGALVLSIVSAYLTRPDRMDLFLGTVPENQQVKHSVSLVLTVVILIMIVVVLFLWGALTLMGLA